MTYTLVVIFVLCAFAAKAVAVSGLAISLRKYADSKLDAWLGSWIIFQAATILFMLAASAVNALNFIAIWSWLTLSALALGRRLIVKRSQVCNLNFQIWHLPLLVMVVAICVRSLSFFDYTGDAYAYGYTRLAIWMNYESLFIHMPTPQINIFTNEWNGEILSLLYGLASNDLQGLTFGNFEVFLVLFASLYSLSRKLGCDSRLAGFISLAVSGTPACLGLAATIKGDLLACVGLVLAAGWIIKYRGTNDCVIYSTILPIAALGLATGAKISSAVACIVLALVLLWNYFPKIHSRSPWIGLLLGVSLACVFCARYFINLIVYGDPLNRAADEGVKAGFDSFAGNLSVIAERWFTFFPTHPPFEVWALSGGLGLTGYAAFICIGLALVDKQAIPVSQKRTAAMMLAVGAVALLLSMTLIGPKDWSLRYFLPVICLILVATFCMATSSWIRKLSYGLPIVAIGNFLMSLQPGEILPNFTSLNPSSNWNAIASMSSVRRALLFHPGTYEVFRVEELGLDDADRGKKILVLAEINVFLFELVGAQAQNRLILTETLDDLRIALLQRPDLVMVIRADGHLPLQAAELIAKSGYSVDVPSKVGDSTLWVAKR